MARFNWLHLSDLHLEVQGSRLSRPEYREALEQDLRRLHAQSGPWHAVFISGDLTMSGSQREFTLLDSTLGSLWEFFRSLGSDPYLLAVPGNHDFWRGGSREPAHQFRALDVRKAFRDTGTSKLGQSVFNGFAPFNDWFSKWRHTRPSPGLEDFRKGLLPGDFAATLSAGAMKVGVVGLNSSFRSSAREATGSMREIAAEQLEKAIGQSLREWGRQHEFLILLTHHSPSRLRSQLLLKLKEELAPEGALLHLCSSGHADRDALLGLQHSLRALVVRAPPLFTEVGSLGGLVKGRLAGGYSAGSLDVPGIGGRLRIFPRMVSSQRGVIALGPDERTLSGASEAIEVPLAELIRGGLLNESSPTPEQIQTEDLSVFPQRNIPPGGESLPLLRVIERGEPSESLSPGVKLRTMMFTGEEMVGWLAWAPSGDALGIGLSGGHVTCWRPGEGAPRWTVKAHKSAVVDLCFAPDGQSLASRSEEDVHLWRADGTRIEYPMPLMGSGLVLAWSRTGVLAADYGGVGAIRLWDIPGKTVGNGNEPDATASIIYAMAWSPDGNTLAVGGGGREAFKLLDMASWRADRDVRKVLGLEVGSDILDFAWKPGSTCVAIACRNGSILVHDGHKVITEVEGHTDAVTSVSFSFDGKLLASKSLDETIRLWRTDTWEEVARIDEPASRLSYAGLALSPTQHVMATLGPGGRVVRIWELDVAALLGAKAPSTTVHEISAKVVLVGEGRAGKSCLAQRMVQDSYEELGSTHGMRFWSMPAAQLPSDTGAAGTRREIILWDMGGQLEYQLVHQLFFRDSTVALMVMEPGRGKRAREEIEDWNQRLQLKPGERDIRKILVGTKADDFITPVDSQAIEAMVKRLGIESYVLTSAKTGQGIPELKATLASAIDWSALEKVGRPELFQRIRELILQLRESRRVVLSFIELQGELRQKTGSDLDPAALEIVVKHLTRQGLIADTRMADGTRMLILEVEQVERYAGSLIVAARENPRGVPALDMARVMSHAMQFPRMQPKERLPRHQELPVLDCVIQLLIENRICLRHEGLLIFPSLFQPAPSEPGAAFPYAISLHYEIFGAIDNIYASLVASLAMSQSFGTMRLSDDRAEFVHAGVDISGVRRVRSQGQSARGMAQLDVYFSDGAPQATRDLFVNIVEQHLREHGVRVHEKLSITCQCGKVFPESTVRKRLATGQADIGCEDCDQRTPLTFGAQESRERNPELVQQIDAVRIIIREKQAEAVTATKVAMQEKTMAPPTQDTGLRILHLSDLHVEADTDPLSLLQPLASDLRDKGEGLGIDRLDYLVISGDITQRATSKEFEKARQFVSELINEFGLTPERCIIVPGNHDLDWETEVYTRKKKRQVDASKLTADTYKEDGDGYYIRDDAKYPERFKNFSDHFYHPLFQKAYPLDPKEQCLSSLFSESRLQFLAMNSAWEIDEYFRERSSIFEDALTRGLTAADKEVAQARKRGELKDGDKILRLSVWHHPITGNEKIRDDAFMGRLQQAGFRVCLHGHVHEDRADLVGYLHPSRRIHVVGAGSFGAPTHERPESVPRLYNVLEVRRDLQQVKVNTRCLRKLGGAWEGWAVWPGEKPGDKRWYYEVPLP